MIITYLLLSNIWAFLFWLGYRTFFMQGVHTQVAKAYLTIAFIISVIAPALNFLSISDTLLPSMITESQVVRLAVDYVHPIRQQQIAIGSNQILGMLYVAIATFLMISYLTRLIMMSKRLKSYPLSYIEGYKIRMQTGYGPGTFFNTIVIPNKDIPKYVFLHEAAHIRRNHYNLRVIISIMTILLFPIIAFHFFRKAYLLLQEYEADNDAAKIVPDYASLMFSALLQISTDSIIQSYYHHPIKRRIMHLQTPKKNKILFLSVFLTVIVVSGISAQTLFTNENSKVLGTISNSGNQKPEKSNMVTAKYKGDLMKDIADLITIPEK